MQCDLLLQRLAQQLIVKLNVRMLDTHTAAAGTATMQAVAVAVVSAANPALVAAAVISFSCKLMRLQATDAVKSRLGEVSSYTAMHQRIPAYP